MMSRLMRNVMFCVFFAFVCNSCNYILLVSSFSPCKLDRSTRQQPDVRLSQLVTTFDHNANKRRAVCKVQNHAAFKQRQNPCFLRPIVSVRVQSSFFLDDQVDVATASTAMNDFPVVPSLLVVVAIVIGTAAQFLIQKQLEGDQGLGSFLKDGSGFSKSAFRPIADGDRAVSQGDPLPWLKLPKLDFVEVAGQTNNNNNSGDDNSNDDDLEATVVVLETLRAELNQQVAKGNTAEAQAIKRRLETIMAEKGIAYNADQK
ncbi:hypothetical protein ACA910_012966 [Epithemia clementina (nom. ined.)]